MKSTCSCLVQEALAIVASFSILITAVACAELSGSDSQPQKKKMEASGGDPAAAGDDYPDDVNFEDFAGASFDDPTRVDNEWAPLKPGTRYVYEGVTQEDDGPVPHRVVINVTDLTKVIQGVRTVVTWDLDYADDELVEAEVAFFAQDNDGNVWRMGEYPEEYEDGEFIIAPAWIAGFEGARPGIEMKADPKPGTPSYAQGWGPAVNWTDRGKVHEIVEQKCVPMDCYEDVLVIEETSLEEPDAFQYKFFARGVGNIRVGWAGDDPTQEVLELTEVVELDADGLAEIRAGALKLEKHAYESGNRAYALTPPMEQN